MKTSLFRFLVCLGCLAYTAAPCSAAFAIFLKIDGVEGESTNDKHKAVSFEI
jgi:hypothetical protein